jgi:23S rRNA (pseudouridine1915-N3)-methyltransferase
MKLLIQAIGHLKKGAELTLCERYAQRIKTQGSEAGLTSLELIEHPEGRGQTKALRQAQEATLLLKSIPKDSYIIALDETGTPQTSDAFATMLGQISQTHAKNIVFCIGGADGLDTSLRQAAQTTLAFGKMTWPHQIVRIMLLEQLYRAITIIRNHPYHKI